MKHIVTNAKTGEVIIKDLTPEELNGQTPTQAEIDAMRKNAYQQEADPIFFKWQRGESTQQEWLDKIAEIRLRYPDVDGL